MNLEIMKNSAYLRNNGIAPTLSYIHKKSGNTIWRSSEISYKQMNSQ